VQGCALPPAATKFMPLVVIPTVLLFRTLAASN